MLTSGLVSHALTSFGGTARPDEVKSLAYQELEVGPHMIQRAVLTPFFILNP